MGLGLLSFYDVYQTFLNPLMIILIWLAIQKCQRWVGHELREEQEKPMPGEGIGDNELEVLPSNEEEEKEEILLTTTKSLKKPSKQSQQKKQEKLYL